MRRLLFALTALLFLPISAAAQDRPGFFDDYADMRAELDGLMRDRAMVPLLERFAGITPAERQNAMAAEMQVRNALPNPLTEAEVMWVIEMEDGFRQEYIAHHDGGTGYIYTRLLIHERAGELLVLSFVTNLDAFTVLGR